MAALFPHSLEKGFLEKEDYFSFRLNTIKKYLMTAVKEIDNGS